MFSRKADGPLMVQVPGAAEDRPSWTKVGVIAAAGFLIGIAWPKLAGVRLGPSVPADAVSSAAVASAGSGRSAAATSVASVPALAASPAGTAAAAIAPAAAPAQATGGAASAGPTSVSVPHGLVFACKTTDGDALKGSDCGTLQGLDGIVMPRLRKLAECPDAAGVSGKLHLVVHADFRRGSLSVDLGKNQTIATADALLACAKADMAGAGASLAALQHDDARYSVAYPVTFGAGAAASAATTNAPVAPASAPPARAIAEPADGTTQVVWEVAIIRDAPKSGKVVARLQRGTNVRLGPVKDGWYPVRYGDGFTNEGWVYRGAVGR